MSPFLFPIGRERIFDLEQNLEWFFKGKAGIIFVINQADRDASDDERENLEIKIVNQIFFLIKRKKLFSIGKKERKRVGNLAGRDRDRNGMWRRKK